MAILIHNIYPLSYVSIIITDIGKENREGGLSRNLP